MAEATGQTEKKSGRKELIGTVVSNKMQKTIVVEVTRKKSASHVRPRDCHPQEVLRA
jgi:ribosomal protein S17